MTLPTTLEEAKLAFPAMWVIYDHPKDYPDEFVARLHFGNFASNFAMTAPTLEKIRELVRMKGGSIPMPRDFNDDAKIVETWI